MAHPTGFEIPLVGEFLRVDDRIRSGFLYVGGTGAVAFFTSGVELGVFNIHSLRTFGDDQTGIVATGAIQFKGVPGGRRLEAAVFVVPPLGVEGDPLGRGLVPLDGEDVMQVADLDLVTLFPSPAAICAHNLVGGFNGGGLRIHQGGVVIAVLFKEFHRVFRNVAAFELQDALPVNDHPVVGWR